MLLAGYLLMCLIFGTTFVAIKVGILGGFPPLLFAGLRFLLAGLMTLALVRMRRIPLPRSVREYKDIALVGLSSTTITFGGLFWAEQHISAGLAAILTAAAPLLVLLIQQGVSKIRGMQWFGIAAGLVGVALVMGPSLTAQGQWITLISAVTLFLGEASHAWGSVRADQIMKRAVEPLALNAFQMLFGGLGLLIGSVAVEPLGGLQISSDAWWALAFLTVIGSVVARGLFYWLIARTGPLFPSTWTYVAPLITTMIGAWFLGEQVTAGTLAGVAFVLGGVGLTDLTTIMSLFRPAKKPTVSSPAWRLARDPANKYGGTFVFGDRMVNLPPDAIVSVTRGERFNLWRLIVNSIANQVVMRQMAKTPGLLYAELTGDATQGSGQTLTVWESQAMVPFRDSGAHRFSKRFLSWVFFGGKAQAYFLTWKANGRIPTAAEAANLVKAYGRHFDGGRLLQKQGRPVWPPEAV